jgi:acetate---CoA ligase (ADP-forming)
MTDEASRLDALIAPRSVAVIGASSDPTRIGGRPIAYMLRRGFDGRIIPVNPNRSEIQGLPAYASIADMPEAPDVAIVAVPTQAAVDAIEQLGARGVKAAIVFTAGFAEVGGCGPALQAQVTATARAHGMRLLGPNSLGLFNDRVGFYGTFSASLEGGFPPPGRVGIVSQSGAYGTHLFTLARQRGLGTPICITTGNEADVTIGEVIGWMVRDDGIDVIAVYAEGIRESASFVAALETARAARKPVVVMKVGRSELGQVSARSHTASIAGDDAVTAAVLAEFGAVRARTTVELLDIAQLAARRIYPAANTLGMITVSGGAGVLVSDAAEAIGLPMPPMPAASQARLSALLPIAAPHNPVDVTAQALNDTSLIGTFAEAMVGEGGYTSVLAFFSQVGGAASMAANLRRELGAVRSRHPDRLYVLSVIAAPDLVAGYEAEGFTVFEDPSAATVAIHAMGRFGEAFARPPARMPEALPGFTLPDTSPNEAEAKRLLTAAGVQAAPEQACADAEAAVRAAEAIGFPVVMKILSPDILHKSEIGGVLLGVASPDAVRAGFAMLMDRAVTAAPMARIEGALVAKQLTGGVECILGIHRDPVFGPVAMFGLGGIFVEVMRDVVFRRCPFGVEEADTMIRSIRAAPLLLGARGRPVVDVAALARMLSRLSVFAHQAGAALQSIDLNPVLAMPQGQGAYAVDAVIDITPDIMADDIA